MGTWSGRDFDDYFREQYPKLVNELDYILGSADLARDVAQDAFIRQYVGWVRLSHYDQPGAWVRRVAIRIAMRTKERAAREVTLDSAGELHAPEVNHERALDVRKAVLQLTPSQRTAVVLHYYRDLPIAEVGRAMGCKESTAKVHLFQARKRLAELLVNYS